MDKETKRNILIVFIAIIFGSAPVMFFAGLSAGSLGLMFLSSFLFFIVPIMIIAVVIIEGDINKSIKKSENYIENTDQLKKLKKLYDEGILNEKEYNEKREKLINDL